MGDRGESPKKGVGGGSVNSHPKGGTREAPLIIIKGRGWGAEYINVALQNTVSPQTVLISKRCVRGACYTTGSLK